MERAFPAWRVRQALNVVNLSTPVGLLLAAAGRARLSRGPRGLVLASGYRFRFPVAGAFTVGDVVLTRHPAGHLERRPRLLAHEERHAVQYAWCLGLPLLPLYAASAAWSWLRTGHPAVANPFERRAGLADGDYPLVGPRGPRRRLPARAAEVSTTARSSPARPPVVGWGRVSGWRRCPR